MPSKRYELLAVAPYNFKVLGPLDDRSAYITTYPSPIQGKHPVELEPGERSICEYNIGVTRGVFVVHRLTDEAS